MIQPLRLRTANAVLPSATLKPTNTINDQIANLKISRQMINEKENGQIFRSKIPVLKSRIGFDCGNNVDQPKKSCTNTIQPKQRQKEELVKKPEIENIDNESNCFLLTDYAPDIYHYLHQLEVYFFAFELFFLHFDISLFSEIIGIENKFSRHT